LTEDFSLLIVTYRRDIEMTERLVKSLQRYNLDSLPVFLVCPSSDIELFRLTLSMNNIKFVAEESIGVPVFDKSDPQTFSSGAGYLNQQIFKLAFSTLGLSDRYLCLDSDVVFVRPFTKWDFINRRTDYPYLFQSEDRELQAESSYSDSWILRKTALQRIECVLNTSESDPFIAVHGFQVFSTREIRSMLSWTSKHSQLSSFKDLISMSGYEYNWYTTWVRTYSSEFVSREPIIKTFHTPREFSKALLFEISEDDYAHGYVGVCVNGNFQHGRGARYPLSLRSNPAMVSGVYLSFFENLRLASISFAGLLVAAFVAGPRTLYRILIKVRRKRE